MIEHGDGLVVVVAHGAGGLRGGAAASQALVDAALAALIEPSFSACDAREWQRVFERVDASLARRIAGETTGVVVVLGAHGVLGLSSGDSEAWIVGDPIDDLTVAQSTWRIGSGRCRHGLTSTSALRRSSHHPRSRSLTRRSRDRAPS